MTIRFDGKVVIVTGAGGGLGRAHRARIRAPRRQGRDQRSGRRGRRHRRQLRRRGSCGQGDHRRRRHGDRQRRLGQATMRASPISSSRPMDAFGRIDVLIANAGILRDKSFSKMELKDFDRRHAGPRHGTVKPAKAVWEIMKDAAIRPHRRDDLVDRPLRQFRPDQLRHPPSSGLVGFMNTLSSKAPRTTSRSTPSAPSPARA